MIELLFSAALAASPVAGESQSLGACIWSRLPAADQQQILTAYDRGMTSATNALQHRDLRLMGAAPDCAGRTDLPTLWVRSAVAGHIVQTGAAAAVLAEKGVDRARLDAAWSAAPAEARDCALANAAKVFAIDGPVCVNRRASEAFARELGLDPTARADRKASGQTLTYMNAKALELIALTLIARAPRS
ncbi:hypothetical protein HNP32_000043 [Brevundimonas bullata]|uniref:Uncharacterized protein n=1 Tax=Brevundimonas bullata TaxID=13160 RepID=A0A7W7IL43_9CAUL|nr:hypothetical protein [Brevundimonas bullata]MBB4796329.1 hypothetical protein [Brevundimonas bullata]MBB6381289.1 hypothetical protein [Brevundimonas bullata]